MRNSKTLVSFVIAFIALMLLSVSASAFVSNIETEVDGISVEGATDIDVQAGSIIPVKVIMTATDNASDVRVKAEISGASSRSFVSERFDLISGRTKSIVFPVEIPSDVDPDERLYLNIEVDARNLQTIQVDPVTLTVMRESYKVEVLDVNIADSTVQAGDVLGMDIILKNRGRKLAEDTFVRVSIPELGVENKAYFGDLSAVDESNPDKEDAAERRISLMIPSFAQAGIYTIQVEAYNADASEKVTKKIAVVGASEDSIVASASSTKQLGIGETGTMSFTLVNSGSKIRLYDFVIDAPEELNVELEKPLTAIPAGMSDTIDVKASSKVEGTYKLAVQVYSDGNLVGTQNFNVKVSGKSSGITATNTTVLLTVVLAIIFIVLLVVLIVLLTKKPEKKEFGESYY